MACVGSPPTFSGSPTLTQANCVNTITALVDAACGSSGYQIEFYRDTSGGFGSETLINTQAIAAGPLTATPYVFVDTPPCFRGNYFYRVKITCAGVVQSTSSTAPASVAQGGAATLNNFTLSKSAVCAITIKVSVTKPCGECAGTLKLFRKANGPVTYVAGELISTQAVGAGPLVAQQFTVVDTPGDSEWHYSWQVLNGSAVVDDQTIEQNIVTSCAPYNPFTQVLPPGQMEKQIVLVNVTRGTSRGYQYTDYRVLNLQEQRAEWWFHKNGGCGSFRFLTHDQFPEIINDTSNSDSWELHVRIKLAGQTVYTTWYRGIIRSVKVEEQGAEQYSDIRGYGYVELLDNIQVQQQYPAGMTVRQIVDDLIDVYIKPNTRIRRPNDVDVTNGNSGVDASPYTIQTPLHFECSALKALKFLAELQGSREFGVDANGYIYFRANIATVIYSFFLNKDIVKKISGGKTFIQANEIKVAGKSFGARDFLQVRPDITDISNNGVYESPVEVPWVTGDNDASAWADNIIAKNKAQQKWSVFTWKNAVTRLDASNPIGKVMVYGDDISNNVDTYDIAKIQYVEGGWITKQELREMGSPNIQPELDQQQLKATYYVGFYPRDLIEELEVRLREQIEFLKGRHKQYRYPNDITNVKNPVTNQDTLGKIPGEIKHYHARDYTNIAISSPDPTNYDITNSNTELWDLTNPRGVLVTWLDKQWTKLALARTFQTLPTRGKYIGEIAALITDVTNRQFGASYVWSGIAWTLLGSSSGGGGGGSGTVTSVALAMPSIFTVSGSPVTTAGTLTATLATQTANTVFAGPTSGGVATPTFRALVAADIPGSIGSLTVTALTDTGLTPNRIVYATTGGLLATSENLYFNGANTGHNTTTPQRTVDIVDFTNPQLRLSSTVAAVYTDIKTDTAGQLNLLPTANTVIIGTTANRNILLIFGSVTLDKAPIIDLYRNGARETVMAQSLKGLVFINSAGLANYNDTSLDGNATLTLDANRRLGVNNGTPQRTVDIYDATNPQLRLSYAIASIYTDLRSDGGGNLLISGTGTAVSLNLSTPYIQFSPTGFSNGYIGGGSALVVGGSVNDIALRSDIGNILFAGNSTERARITNLGYMGIKTTTPRRILDVLDVTNPQLRLTLTDNTVYTDFQTLSGGVLTITPTGNQMQLGTGAETYMAARGGTNFAVVGTVPLMTFYETDPTADNKVWETFVNGGQLFSRVVNDNSSAATTWLTVTRSVANVTSIAFTNAPVRIGTTTDGTVGGDFSAGLIGATRVVYIAATGIWSLANSSQNTTFQTTSTGMLGIIPSGGSVGINTTTPTANESYSRLTVTSSDAVAHVMSIENSGAGQSGLILRRTGGTASRAFIYLPSGANTTLGFFNTVDGLFITTGGQLLAAQNGTAAAPSWAFLNNLNSGMYTNGTTLQFAQAGVIACYVDTAGTVFHSLGALDVGSTVVATATGDFAAGINAGSHMHYGVATQTIGTFGANSTTPGFVIGNVAETQHWLIYEIVGGTGDIGDLYFRDMVAGGSRITIQQSTGLVGIGTLLPQVLLDVNGGFATRASTPTILNNNTNDFTFTGGTQAFTYQRVSASVVLTISGFAGGFDGKYLVITNVGAVNILISNQDANSAAANRVLTGTANTITIGPDQSAEFIYDAVVSRWRLNGVGSSSSSSASFGTISTNPPLISLNPFIDLNGGRVLIGTPEQVYVTDNGPGNGVQLSTPQDIGKGSVPTFAGIVTTGGTGFPATPGPAGTIYYDNVNKFYYYNADGNKAWYPLNYRRGVFGARMTLAGGAILYLTADQRGDARYPNTDAGIVEINGELIRIPFYNYTSGVNAYACSKTDKLLNSDGTLATVGCSASTMYFAYIGNTASGLPKRIYLSATPPVQDIQDNNGGGYLCLGEFGDVAGSYCSARARNWRFIGAVYLNSSIAFSDSETQRHLYNYYNRQQLLLNLKDTTDNWVYTTKTFRNWNNNANNVVSFVNYGEMLAHFEFNAMAGNSGAGLFYADVSPSTAFGGISSRILIPGSGVRSVARAILHGTAPITSISPLTISPLEASDAVGTTTWYGDNGDAAFSQSGLTGWIWG